ncbi:helix-turn-helix domain-containing protein [Streptosporangium sp. NPDC002721]|uniref:helix-turn-helix domain-containing protein n=1 Tax=Streptosporangium sp. NPDC002721 TaxID=3366188 RepID=UPI0036C7F616
MPKLLFARAPKDAIEERTIRKLAGARHAPADWIRRAQIIALSWERLRVPQIARELGCAEKTVRYRLARFNDQGLDGLGDRPGVGRKRRISEAERSQIIALARTSPAGRPVRDRVTGELAAADEAGPGVWTLDTLTEAVHELGIVVARSQVRRILLAEGVRWRHTRSWATSHDPDFAPKEPALLPSTPAPRRE